MKDLNSQISPELREELSNSYWITALSIPLTPWIQPFFPFLEIPTIVQENLPLWAEIYARYLAELKARIDRLEAMTRKELETIYPSGIWQAMHQLAEQGGVPAALELERWVRRYFRNHESHIPLGCWDLIFSLALLAKEDDRVPPLPPPPTALEPLIPDLKQLKNQFNEARYEIDDIAPYAHPDAMNVRCAESIYVKSALWLTFPVQVLRRIAQQLDRTERQEMMIWAEHQVPAAIPLIKPGKLCGDKYLRVEPPGFDMPSILGFSEP